MISDSENIPILTPLCKTHYYYLYWSLQPLQTNYITCGTDLRNKVSRTCPRPDVIESHLRDNTGFEGQIKEHNKVCYSCYKFHTSILREANTVSTDSDLRQIIDKLKNQIPEISEIKTTEEMDGKCCMQYTKQQYKCMGEKLLVHQVILYHVYMIFFVDCATDIVNATNMANVTKTNAKKILILSLDTDVSHIGLPLACTKTKEVIVKVSSLTSRQLKYINLSELHQRDPDLAHINTKLRPQIIQTLFVVSGCDYVSFLAR